MQEPECQLSDAEFQGCAARRLLSREADSQVEAQRPLGAEGNEIQEGQGVLGPLEQRGEEIQEAQGVLRPLEQQGEEIQEGQGALRTLEQQGEDIPDGQGGESLLVAGEQEIQEVEGGLTPLTAAAPEPEDAPLGGEGGREGKGEEGGEEVGREGKGEEGGDEEKGEGEGEGEGTALVELLDEGWFTSKVAWSGRGWLWGAFGLSTIKEAPNETEEEGGGQEEESQGEALEGSNAESSHSPTRDDQVAVFERHEELRGASSLNDGDEGSTRGGLRARRRPTSPASSDEESVHGARRRRGRSGARRRTKRSSSAENSRGHWRLGMNESGILGPVPGQGACKLGGSATPPCAPALAISAVQPSPEDVKPPRGRFMRTRSVSDYETKGAGVSSLWDTPPGSKSTAKSLTDADVEELKGFFDLGFKFQQSQMSPHIAATLPALRLYQAVGSIQQKILSQRQQSPTDPARAKPAPASATEAAPVASASETLPRVPPQAPSSMPSGASKEAPIYSESDGSTSAKNRIRRTSSIDTPGPFQEHSWSIADPSDNPVDVKTNLRLWAQAVASTVRQTC